MSKRSRGPALIINNENFNDKSLTRTGSKVDKNNLNDLLDEFGFQVKSFFWVGFWSWPSFFKSQPTSFVGLTAHATLTSGLELFKLFLLFPFWSNKWVKENWASTFDSITYRSESETKVLRGKLIFYLHIVVRSNLIKVSTKSNRERDGCHYHHVSWCERRIHPGKVVKTETILTIFYNSIHQTRVLK